jgi:hypothetical protein
MRVGYIECALGHALLDDRLDERDQPRREELRETVVERVVVRVGRISAARRAGPSRSSRAAAGPRIRSTAEAFGARAPPQGATICATIASTTATDARQGQVQVEVRATPAAFDIADRSVGHAALCETPAAAEVSSARQAAVDDAGVTAVGLRGRGAWCCWLSVIMARDRAVYSNLLHSHANPLAEADTDPDVTASRVELPSAGWCQSQALESGDHPASDPEAPSVRQLAQSDLPALASEASCGPFLRGRPCWLGPVGSLSRTARFAIAC